MPADSAVFLFARSSSIRGSLLHSPQWPSTDTTNRHLPYHINWQMARKFKSATGREREREYHRRPCRLLPFWWTHSPEHAVTLVCCCNSFVAKQAKFGLCPQRQRRPHWPSFPASLQWCTASGPQAPHGYCSRPTRLWQLLQRGKQDKFQVQCADVRVLCGKFAPLLTLLSFSAPFWHSFLAFFLILT